MTLDEATRAQHRAADPGASTWLSANAGSGKTRVLTDRVARLLLNGVDPGNVLCLTFTKAAASEMQNRLFSRLGSWAMRDDGALRDDLRGLGVARELGSGDLARARTLFAQALETPGGLKIQTIHSFCAALLRRFPIEAGVTPEFVEMDEGAARLMMNEVVEAVAAGPDGDVIGALAGHLGGTELGQLAADIASRRDAFAAPLDRAGALRLFGLAQDVTAQGIAGEVFTGGEAALLRELAEVCGRGKPTDLKASAALGKLDLERLDARALDCLEHLMLYGAGAKDPFGPKLGKFPTSEARGLLRAPSAADLDALMLRVADARGRRLALGCAEKTAALHAFAAAFLPVYDAAKARRGWLDFDDLILKARALLSDAALADWVLFRLDGGLDHILVDEAQDTSPEQWSVIERLAEEFAAGRGARGDITRTLFVVGDKKQSIYSFQGADPEAFDRMHNHFSARLESGPGLNRLALEVSFRSSPAILSVVDATFVGRGDQGLGGDVLHRPFHHAMPGRVDIWPIVPKPETPDDGAWFEPVDRPAPNAPEVVLARQIAGELRRFIDTGETIPTKEGRRPLGEGDVLILVQRRNRLFHEIIRACKAAGLEVAGADRLQLTDELAVRDLITLMSFLALPEDDLSLATILRSPLFGWSEGQLYDLAATRGRAYLWQALRGRDNAAVPVLRDLLDAADFLRPYDLLERALVRHRGRSRLVARLGAEAEDGIDELLTQALAYERLQVPSLTGFLAWLQGEDVEVRREAAAAGNSIRVMTVHGAKGLESPLVILPDTLRPGPQLRGDILLAEGGVPCWKVAKEAEAPPLPQARAARQRAEVEERLRLLYVAMTRAECWLIACGAGTWTRDDGTWYDQIRAGAEAAGGEAHSFEGGPGVRFMHGTWHGGALAPAAATDGVAPVPPPPDRPAPAAPERPQPISPSDLGGAKALPGEGLDEASALRRGRQVHLLLEHLPAHPRAAWPEAAAALLGYGVDAADAGEIAALLAEAQEVIEAPALAPLFSPEALAEVGIAATLPDGRRMRGTLDRLVVRPDRVLCIDFKTNAVVPASSSQTPDGLLRQMGAYATGLARIYPDRRIETAILWTRTATLMPLPPDLVAEALRAACP